MIFNLKNLDEKKGTNKKKIENKTKIKTHFFIFSCYSRTISISFLHIIVQLEVFSSLKVLEYGS
jgi:hypothetical protein